MAGSYTYSPENIKENSRNKMRFELGDTMTEGGAETCALSDEEYDAILSRYPDPADWKRAKLALIESILHRFSYEVDTTVGPLSLSLSQRLDFWRRMKNDLKAELAASGFAAVSGAALAGGHVFSMGMNDNPRVYPPGGGLLRVP